MEKKTGSSLAAEVGGKDTVVKEVEKAEAAAAAAVAAEALAVQAEETVEVVEEVKDAKEQDKDAATCVLRLRRSSSP